MTRSWTSRTGRAALDLTPRTVIAAARIREWHIGLSLGWPVWWMPRIDRDQRGGCAGWGLVSVAWRRDAS